MSQMTPSRFAAKCCFRLANPYEAIPYLQERLGMTSEDVIDLMNEDQFLADLDRYKRAYIEIPAYARMKSAMARRAIRGDVSAAQALERGISDKDKVTIEETRKITGTMESLGKLLSGSF